MSILLGPLSETMSNVSWRDCALAGDQIAGAAGSTLPAANAVIDLRNSRRFMATSQSQRVSAPGSAKVMPEPGSACGRCQPADADAKSAGRPGRRRAVGGGLAQARPNPRQP